MQSSRRLFDDTISHSLVEDECLGSNGVTVHSVRESFLAGDKGGSVASNNNPTPEMNGISKEDETCTAKSDYCKKGMKESPGNEDILLVTDGDCLNKSLEPLKISLDFSSARSPESFAKALRDGLKMLNDEFTNSGGKLDSLAAIEIGFSDGSKARFASNEKQTVEQSGKYNESNKGCFNNDK